MIYLVESKIPEKKSVFFALKYIYGINQYTSFLFCKKLGFSKNLKIKNLSKEQIIKLLKLLESSNILIGSSLKKTKKLILQKLILIKSYRGLRRNDGLPVRGQRTHTNARNARKNRH